MFFFFAMRKNQGLTAVRHSAEMHLCQLFGRQMADFPLSSVISVSSGPHFVVRLPSVDRDFW